MKNQTRKMNGFTLIELMICIAVAAIRDGNRDASEPLLQTSQAMNAMAIVTSADRKRVTYHSDGSTPGSNLTFTFCDVRGTRDAATIVIGNAGRPRQGKVNAEEAALACGAVHR